MRGVGLANNGGSRTLIRCAETLCELGHDAFFHTGKSYYTWHKADIKCIGGKDHPPCDVSIATGANSYEHVARYSGGPRVAYVRGLELWKAKEARLLELFRKMDHIFVNSEWLLAYMKQHGIEATLQYPGIDWGWFCPQPLKKQHIGALRNQRHKTKRHVDIDALELQLGMPILQLNRHIKRPTPEKLNAWYNTMRVWFAPTELEGLHNPPQEAAMTGCVIVATDHPRGGMQDYVVHEQTGLLYPARDIRAAAEAVLRVLHDENLRQRLQRGMMELLVKKLGTREERMAEFVSRLRAV